MKLDTILKLPDSARMVKLLLARRKRIGPVDEVLEAGIREYADIKAVANASGNVVGIDRAKRIAAILRKYDGFGDRYKIVRFRVASFARFIVAFRRIHAIDIDHCLRKKDKSFGESFTKSILETRFI